MSPLWGHFHGALARRQVAPVAPPLTGLDGGTFAAPETAVVIDGGTFASPNLDAALDGGTFAAPAT